MKLLLDCHLYYDMFILFNFEFYHSFRLKVPVDSMNHMVGSYPPKMEPHSYQTPPEDAPSGMMQRGTYQVKSLFTDDDKNEILKWEWAIDIKKDWE